MRHLSPQRSLPRGLGVVEDCLRQVLGVDEGQLVGPDLLALLGVLDGVPAVVLYNSRARVGRPYDVARVQQQKWNVALTTQGHAYLAQGRGMFSVQSGGLRYVAGDPIAWPGALAVVAGAVLPAGALPQAAVVVPATVVALAAAVCGVLLILLFQS